ncbi:hypothetical protein Thi970DRAFT_04880 [Thiorhodovibrio frisius]|uniref:Uncharacterized protein n=1 Tax=Thiorhodovibrio frisius TaxID=631362 RepID=H8Z8F8_9GAMM|nr:hypothetical protein Thi970DRAFT_04880 [Thiorhodovibrio frisius]WPL22338.1 hypothetical protein Thiofri_02498 [Thiorhodovibrio frisius]
MLASGRLRSSVRGRNAHRLFPARPTLSLCGHSGPHNNPASPVASVACRSRAHCQKQHSLRPLQPHSRLSFTPFLTSPVGRTLAPVLASVFCCRYMPPLPIQSCSCSICQSVHAANSSNARVDSRLHLRSRLRRCGLTLPDAFRTRRPVVRPRRWHLCRCRHCGRYSRCRGDIRTRGQCAQRSRLTSPTASWSRVIRV